MGTITAVANFAQVRRLTSLVAAADSANTVVPDNAGITANGIAISASDADQKENQVAINSGIKSASLIVPYGDDLPNP